MGSRLPARGTGPMLLVVMTPISGMSLAMRWMIDGWVVTMPEGTVKGPEIGLPKNVVNVVLTVMSQSKGNEKYTGVNGALVRKFSRMGRRVALKPVGFPRNMKNSRRNDVKG